MKGLEHCFHDPDRPIAQYKKQVCEDSRIAQI